MAEKQTFYQKILLLQEKLGAIKKEDTAKIPTKNGGSYEYRYININTLIAEVKPLLNELGLIIMQPIKVEEGRAILKTSLFEADGIGNLSSEIPLPEGLDPQQMGSAITYYRRYALLSMLFIEAEDDDGASATAAYSRPAGVESQVGRNATVSEEYPPCKDCGASQKKSMAGKIYCSNKCWLPENAHLRKAPNIMDYSDDGVPMPTEEIPF